MVFDHVSHTANFGSIIQFFVLMFYYRYAELYNKYRNKLYMKSDLRLRLDSFIPDIDPSVEDKFSQKSH